MGSSLVLQSDPMETGSRMTPGEAPCSSAASPWRSGGTHRSWGGKHELPKLQARIAAADTSSFEQLSSILLRPALSPPGRLLGAAALRRQNGGLVADDGQGVSVAVGLMPFAEAAQDLGLAHVRRCKEVVEDFARGPIRAGTFLLVHNRDTREPAFRHGVESELAALRESGRVTHALAWGARDLVETAFDGLYDFVAAVARGDGSLSVVPSASLAVGGGDLVADVPLRISWLASDQHRLGPDAGPGVEEVADPATLLLQAEPSVRTVLLGGFGYGKTTAVARSLARKDLRVLYVPGSSLTQEITAAKVFLSRCVNAEALFAACDLEEREVYAEMLPAVVEHLFKDASLPCVLVIDGLDESPYLCRQAGLTHLLNNLETVRIPVVLAMRSEYWSSRSGDLRSTAGLAASHGEPRRRRLRKLELLPWRQDEIRVFIQRFRDGCESAAERRHLADLERLVAEGRFEDIYGDIPRRPLFLRLIAQSAAAVGLPLKRIGRARLFRDWALWKIRRDLEVPRPHLVFEGEPVEEVQETAWEAMLWAAASMTREREGELELLPDCSFDRLRQATTRLARMLEVLALSLQSLLVLAHERTGDRKVSVAFAHRAFQEFFLAWFLAESQRERDWRLPESVREWIEDLRREGLIDSAARREAARPPGLPAPPTRPSQWEPKQPAGAGREMPAAAGVPAADLVLHVLERPGGRQWIFDLRLTALDPALDLQEQPFGIIKMQTNPAEFFRRHLRTAAGERSVDGGSPSLGARLLAQGAYFAEELLSPELRKTLAALRGRCKTLQIVSDDPWIPWEVLRIEESRSSAVVDGPFLCEAFALTRWIHTIRQTAFLPLARIAAVVPRDLGPRHAEGEWDDLESLAGDGRRVERLPARARAVGEALRSGRYDGWHFAGHALFLGDEPDLSPIRLEEGEDLRPVDLSGEARRMGVCRPLVFLNACETGRSGLSLTDAGGWAPHFLRAGAGAFLGSLWPIRDACSRQFARAFYASFVGGLPLADAVAAAREAVRSEDDSAWIAYTVFGHPGATCRPVPGARRDGAPDPATPTTPRRRSRRP